MTTNNNNKEIIYVDELQSSGNEDNFIFILLIIIYALFLIIFISRNWTEKRIMNLSIILIILTIFSFALIQVGEIFTTIINLTNFYLLFIILIPIGVLTISILNYLRIKNYG